MRIIPPKHYHGRIPSGFEKKDFMRFDSDVTGCYGILPSGEKINCENDHKQTKKLSVMGRLIQAWEKLWCP